MSDLTLNAVFGPRYEIVIDQSEVKVEEGFNLVLETKAPLTLEVGTGFNNAASSSDTVDVKITTAQVINAYRAVGYDGYMTPLTLEGLSMYAGISKVAALAGEKISVVRQGLIEESAWAWTTNAPVFISEMGVLTQTLPNGPVRRIGWAITPTKLNLDPYPIIGV